MTSGKNFEAIIIGGSYAGLSAAMALGRSLRKVLVIDNGDPCNARTPHSHNFLTQDGKTPREITMVAKEQVAHYETIQFHKGFAETATKTKNLFHITTATGEVFHSQKLILATGIKDELPDIQGLAECWGKSVIHCPYCHGYEFRSQKTGILANGDAAFHLAMLVNNLTRDLTIFTNGSSSPVMEQAERLKQHHIAIIETGVAAMEHDKGNLQKLVLKDGSEIPLDALYARVPFVQHSNIAATLGCEITAHGYIKTDEFQKTTVEGVFACGDNCNPMRSVANAVANGNFAGAMANMELAEEVF